MNSVKRQLNLQIVTPIKFLGQNGRSESEAESVKWRWKVIIFSTAFSITDLKSLITTFISFIFERIRTIPSFSQCNVGRKTFAKANICPVGIGPASSIKTADNTEYLTNYTKRYFKMIVTKLL